MMMMMMMMIMMMMMMMMNLMMMGKIPGHSSIIRGEFDPLHRLFLSLIFVIIYIYSQPPCIVIILHQR